LCAAHSSIARGRRKRDAIDRSSSGNRLMHSPTKGRCGSSWRE
jgi:hypothetical protein